MARNLVSIVKEKMIEYYAGDSRRVHHFLKVHSFAKLIAEMEGMEPDEMQVLEIAALAHDIGIKNAELKYGYNAAVERACYLVAHHHTYRNIDGLDYLILVEADFLVNMYEDKADADTIRTAYDNIFATESGKMLCRQLFSLEY